jgi:prolyl-tRNA synthetase
MEKINALEVGHIFKLREKYAGVLGVKFLDASGRQCVAQMGCYGIGVSRLIPAVIEQHHDADGIIWPRAVSPVDVMVVPVNVADSGALNAANLLHGQLEEAGLSVLVDDRDERAGVKFKDADLLGFPVRITIGKKWAQTQKFEVMDRRTRQQTEAADGQILSTVIRMLEESSKGQGTGIFQGTGDRGFSGDRVQGTGDRGKQ